AAKPIFEPLDKATALEHCRFKLDFAKGMAINLPHIGKMRQATRLYALRAVLHTEKGDGAKAADMLARGIATAEALRHEPILISALVRIACHAIVTTQLERTVSRLPLPDKALQTLGERLAVSADPAIATGAMVGERCFGMDIYQAQVLGAQGGDVLQMLGNGPPLGVMTRLLPRAYFKNDMIVYIDIMNAYVDASRKPYPQSVLEGVRIGETLDKTIPRYYVISRMILPALGRVYSTAQRYMATCDTARVALACLRHRAKHGRLPATLDALVPAFLDAVPPDPFTGKALLYRKDIRGFVVYAVGENKKDDGGNTGIPADHKAPDVGFRVWWPKAEF
ncbi:hypothetical protein HQ560_12175, partial [bacterium]|nr:hypothetical protein [bacterium]